MHICSWLSTLLLFTLWDRLRNLSRFAVFDLIVGGNAFKVICSCTKLCTLCWTVYSHWLVAAKSCNDLIIITDALWWGTCRVILKYRRLCLLLRRLCFQIDKWFIRLWWTMYFLCCLCLILCFNFTVGTVDAAHFARTITVVYCSSVNFCCESHWHTFPCFSSLWVCLAAIVVTELVIKLFFWLAVLI